MADASSLASGKDTLDGSVVPWGIAAPKGSRPWWVVGVCRIYVGAKSPSYLFWGSLTGCGHGEVARVAAHRESALSNMESCLVALSRARGEGLFGRDIQSGFVMVLHRGEIE